MPRATLRILVASLLVALLAPACGTLGTRPARPELAGRVTFGGAPVAGATVSVIDAYLPSGPHVAFSARCADDGAFRVEVPAGSWFVAASGRFEGKAVFAWSGQNPVRIDSGSRWIGVKSVAETQPPRYEPASGGRGASVAGTVRFNGEPSADAYVYVYASPEGHFKGMGYAMSPPTGADGRFAVDGLPESGYYLVARRRAAGGLTGPLEKGDLFGFFPGNPVYLKDGQAAVLDLEMVEKEKALSYSEVTSGVETVLRGRVVDKAGVPQAGVYAFVYDNRVFGQKRPYAHSGKTGADGRFSIFLDRGGLFYLGARERFGNSPTPGERFGFYDGTPDHAVLLPPSGKVEGLTVVVDPILPEGK
jgi:hypothetical protein